jgi:hypothetical protein
VVGCDADTAIRDSYQTDCLLAAVSGIAPPSISIREGGV